MTKPVLPITARVIVATFLALFAAFILCQVPLTVAAICAVIVVVQSATGACIYQFYLVDKQAHQFDYLTIGFAIGSATSVFTALICRSFLSPTFGWMIPTALMILSYVFGKKKLSIVNRDESKSLLLEFLVVSTIACLYLAQDSHWPTSIFVCGVCIYIGCVWRHHNRWLLTAVRTVAFTAALVGFIGGVTKRPPFWTYVTDDFRVFESLSRSIWNFGPQDPYGTLGTIGAKYHFATYAYSGLLDRLSGAQNFVVLNQVMLVLSALLVSMMVWAFMKREGGKVLALNFILAAMFPLFFDYSYTSPSYCFGVFFYLAGVFFWTDRRHQIRIVPRIFIGCILTAFIITTKISNIPAVICGLGLLAVYALFFKPIWRNAAIVNLFASLTISGTYFIFFLANTRTSSQVKSTYAFGYARRIAGDLVSINDASLRITASLMYTSIYLVLPIVGIVIFLFKYRSNVSPLILFALPSAPLVLVTALFGGSDASGYFVLSCLVLLNVSLLIHLSRYFQTSIWNLRQQFPLYTLAISACAGGILAHRMISRFNGGTQNEVLIRSILLSHWLVALALTIVWYVLQKLLKNVTRHQFMIGFLVAELVCFASVEGMLLDRLTKGAELTSAESFVALGTNDEISVGKWIRQNTPPQALIATNHFCGAQCTGPNWFENDYKNLDDTYLYPQSPTGYGGFDFILSDYAERRFLIEGSRFLLVNGMPRQEVRERMKLVLNFANTPGVETIQSLKDLGVDYFVLEKKASITTDFDQFGRSVFDNNSYLVIQ
ncbi:MAG: hypothetical protein WCR08_12575, partial [Gammaproteobacteria bacterium]